MSRPAIIFDESAFDEFYLPEQIVGRERETKEIARCLEPARNGKSIRSIFIWGQPGSGKTLACRHVLKNFQRQSVYVNCWSDRTTHKVLQTVLTGMGQVVHGRESASDLVKRFQAMGRKAIVCLDESDHLKDSDVLYILARNSCGVMLISNSSSPLPKIDPRIRSSLLLSEIEFKPYSRDEIVAIMRERIARGMEHSAIELNILKLIANACGGGDARVALQTLKIAAKEAESKSSASITMDDIRDALKCSRRYRLSNSLARLNDDQKLVYNILRKNGPMASGDLFREYHSRSREPVVDRAYRAYMELLREMGLVTCHGNGRWKVYETSS